MAEPLPSQLAVYPRFPIDVWEHVIDVVYDDRYYEAPIAATTLSSCALVCRAWRPRAQRVLFHYVILRDRDALCRFAELIDALPSLGTYVRQLALRGYLHVPHSPAVLFLTALRGRLTNLKELLLVEFHRDEKAAKPLPEGEKELPCLPFHRYFESLLTSVLHIRQLCLLAVRFPSFGDFARFLSALRNLQGLHCQSISWAVLGGEPACLAKCRSSDYQNTFLPNFNTLECYDMEEEGMQRLLSALGPSLQTLWTKFPNKPPSLRVEHPDGRQDAPSLCLDLHPFPHLDCLSCALAPFTRPIEQTLESLRDTLISWVPKGDDELDVSPSKRCLLLWPCNAAWFTREQFVELLRTIGPIVEGGLCRRESDRVDLGYEASEDTDDHPETNPCKATLVVEELRDRLEWEEWWRTAIAECFPMLSRWNRLVVLPTGMVSQDMRWQDYDQTPQDYTDRLQAALRTRRHRKQKTMSRFIAALGKLVPRRKVLKQF